MKINNNVGFEEREKKLGISISLWFKDGEYSKLLSNLKWRKK